MGRILDESSISELIGTVEICKRHNIPLNQDECDWIIDALMELWGMKTAWRTPPEIGKREVNDG